MFGFDGRKAVKPLDMVEVLVLYVYMFGAMLIVEEINLRSLRSLRAMHMGEDVGKLCHVMRCGVLKAKD